VGRTRTEGLRADAPQDTRNEVVAHGAAAAGRFLRGWDWERYRRDCRSSLPPAA